MDADISRLYFDYEAVPGPNAPGGIDLIIKSMEAIKNIEKYS